MLAERLHGLLSEKEALERQKQERLLNTVSQTLDRTISSRLDKTVREEMRQRVIPCKLFNIFVTIKQ